MQLNVIIQRFHITGVVSLILFCNVMYGADLMMYISGKSICVAVVTAALCGTDVQEKFHLGHNKVDLILSYTHACT